MKSIESINGQKCTIIFLHKNDVSYNKYVTEILDWQSTVFSYKYFIYYFIYYTGNS